MKPLAERLRPQTLKDFINQEHLTAPGAPIYNMLKNKALSSMILWGPPGSGKTTLAYIIGKESQKPFYKLSATDSGKKEVKEILQKVKNRTLFNKETPILFIDEIHRFNKLQQDALLEAVEKGEIILIGSTTENPSFEVISPLLSRCQVFILKPLEKKHLQTLLNKAIEKDEILKQKNITLKETETLINFSNGDARKLLNILELIVNTNSDKKEIIIDNQLVIDILKNTPLSYDKHGEWHYDIISAFIKSIRGSDPDAAVYWLARMLEAGEDIRFIARRMIISAAEDIGLANPNALLLATETFKAVDYVGMPEARIILANTAIYLALSPKSNSAYKAINKAQEIVKQTGNLPVPLHLRNAPTDFMKKLGYGAQYKYPHDYPNNYVIQQYLPEEIKNLKFYIPSQQMGEQKLIQRLNQIKKQK